MPILTIRLPAELHQRFLAACEAREVTPSEFGRRAVEAIVDGLESAAELKHLAVQARKPGKTAMNQAQFEAKIAAIRNPRGSSVRGFAIDGSPLVAPPERLKKK